MEYKADGRSFRECLRSGDVVVLSAVDVPVHKVVSFSGSMAFFDPSMILHSVFKAKKSGELKLEFGAERIVVYFSGGSVINAHSSSASHRLGEFVVRSGAISREDLERMIEQIPPGMQIGRFLVEMKVLSAKALFQIVNEQVVEIVKYILDIKNKKGVFVFFENEKIAAETVVLALNQDLIIHLIRNKLDEIT